MSDQYKSVFVHPRQEWVVEDVKDFFTNTGGGGDSLLTDIEFNEMDIATDCS